METEWIRGLNRRWSNAEMHGRGGRGDGDRGRKWRGEEADFAELMAEAVILG